MTDLLSSSVSFSERTRNKRGKHLSRANSIRYALLPAPWGELGVAGMVNGLLHIDLHPSSGNTFKEGLGRRFEEDPVNDPGFFKDFSIKLRQYFSGVPVSFDAPVILDGFSPFQTKVLKTLRSIPFGRSLSYAGLGLIAGAPGAARAVGGACGRNPLPLVIPCHRVLRSDGCLGGFSGGLDMKRRLLRIEKLAFKENTATRF